MKKKYLNTKWRNAGTSKKEYKILYTNLRGKAKTILKQKYKEDYREILKDLINKEFNKRIEKERNKVLERELK